MFFVQVNPEFKDNTVESKGEVSQSKWHVSVPTHYIYCNYPLFHFLLSFIPS